MSDSKRQSLGSLGSKAKHVDKVIEQTKANDHFIDEHEDSFIINLADDGSTDESCDDYHSSTETASEGE